MTSRRSFLATLAGAFALDPERALWVPGAKTISVPAPRLFLDGWILDGWRPTEGCNCVRCVTVRGFVDPMIGFRWTFDSEKLFLSAGSR